MHDPRSPEALAYRKHYRTPRWQSIRTKQLKDYPLCQWCKREGRVTAATVCDHIKPHRGDIGLFYDPENVQSLCQDCHDGRKKYLELHGFSADIGLDGWPKDARHPANK